MLEPAVMVFVWPAACLTDTIKGQELMQGQPHPSSPS
jgi:hypothetical protein